MSEHFPEMARELSRRALIGAALGNVALTALSRVRTAAADAGGSIVSRLRPEHPRLWVSGAEFDVVRDRIASSPVSAQWYANLRGSAGRILDSVPSEYELPDGVRLLATSRRVRNRVLALTMLYQLDGDDAYAERTWAELEAAANFPDWNPSHFLDTAEMTHAFAIDYDWLYHYLSEERRHVIRNAIVEMGLAAGLPEYRDGLSWSVNTTNWNLVCNGGLGTGALAIGDEAPEIAEEILTSGLDSIPLGIGPYAPDGGYPEGIGSYWAYGTRYLVAYLASLQTAIDTDFGLSDSAGLSETGYFPIYLTGPTGQNFNYYDAGTGAPYPPEMCWLASIHDRPIFSWWGRKNSGGSSRHLLWYDPDNDSAGPRVAELPFDTYFRHSEVVTVRSAWDDPRAVFVGFKGGDNQTSHGDLDLGTFVLAPSASGGRRSLVPKTTTSPDTGITERTGSGGRTTVNAPRARTLSS